MFFIDHFNKGFHTKNDNNIFRSQLYKTMITQAINQFLLYFLTYPMVLASGSPTKESSNTEWVLNNPTCMTKLIRIIYNGIRIEDVFLTDCFKCSSFRIMLILKYSGSLKFLLARGLKFFVSGFVSFPEIVVGATGETKTVTAFWWDKKPTSYYTNTGFK